MHQTTNEMLKYLRNFLQGTKVPCGVLELVRGPLQSQLKLLEIL